MSVWARSTKYGPINLSVHMFVKLSPISERISKARDEPEGYEVGLQFRSVFFFFSCNLENDLRKMTVGKHI